MSLADAALDTVLSRLNPQQREAAAHRQSPLLIVAGAGTGKTTTLAHRVAARIADGIAPERILLLTFTRRAAAEMLRRVDGILLDWQRSDESGGAAMNTSKAAKAASRRVWGGTFHAVANRLLRKYGQYVGLDSDFSVMDRSDSEDLMNVVREDLSLGGKGTRFPQKGTCLAIYSRCVNGGQTLLPVLESTFPWCLEHEPAFKELFRTYVDRKQELSVLDYDDLLLFWRELAEHDSGGAKLRSQFDCVMVDEYQDTNIVQSGIVRAMKPDGEGVTVVGDDAQSIYAFRAATVRNILDFPKQFPGTTIVTLEQNYRSTQPILEATNTVIAEAAERHRKDLWSLREAGERPAMVLCGDEDEQTDYVIARVLEHREQNIALRKQAVLFRASHHSMALEVELARRNIPFHKFGGLKFIETAHVKDLLAYLRLAENARDLVSGVRVLTLLPGVGQGRARQYLQLLSEGRGDFSAWRDVAPPRAAGDMWPQLVNLMVSLAGPEARKATITEQVHAVRTFYSPLLERQYDNPRPRLMDLEQLELLSSRFRDRQQFLTEMTLDPPANTQDLAADPLLDEDYLILSTIHSAKGLEWDCVYVIHAADGNIPSEMSTGKPEEIEEERRLFYVALTRAKDWLYVTVPQRYYHAGRFRSDSHSYAQPTRFLTKPALKHFRKGVALAELPPRETAVEGALTQGEVRDRIKDIWR